MGAQCSSGSIKPAYRIHFLGVDKEGQLILFKYLRLRIGEADKLAPRIAFFIEEISTDFRDEENWYYGGRCSERAFYHYFHETSHGLVYVINSSDPDEFNAALDKLDRYILKDDNTQNKVMMILANRQDVEGALSLEKIESKVKEKLSAHEPTLGGRVLFLKGCNSETKAGIKEAFSWLAQIVQQHIEDQLTPGYHSFLENDITGKKEEKNPLHSLKKKVFEVSYIKSVLLR